MCLKAHKHNIIFYNIIGFINLCTTPKDLQDIFLVNDKRQQHGMSLKRNSYLL